MMDLTNHPYALPDNLEPIKEVDPLDFLKEVIRNLDLPLSVRMRAAIEMLPFMHPKLAVTAQVSEMNDLATMLDRRIKRYQGMKMIEHRPPPPMEPSPSPPPVDVKPPMAKTPDRRYRRI
jgi:hypothetical protein